MASSDFDRPINDRGIVDAPLMAAFLKEEGVFPDQIFCSSAVRAFMTAKLIAKGIGISDQSILADRRMYLADVNQMQSIFREFSDEWESVFVVGHNPTITDCANALTGDDVENVPTCGVYGIELNVDSWLKLRNGVGRRLFFKVPKELKS